MDVCDGMCASRARRAWYDFYEMPKYAHKPKLIAQACEHHQRGETISRIRGVTEQSRGCAAASITVVKRLNVFYDQLLQWLSIFRKKC